MSLVKHGSPRGSPYQKAALVIDRPSDYWLHSALTYARPVALTLGLITGLSAGLIVGLNRGGSAVIKHYALRLTLWLKGHTPLNFIEFLDHCAKLILLKKVGGGYIFIHRMLLEHFADLPITEKSGGSKSGSSR